MVSGVGEGALLERPAGELAAIAMTRSRSAVAFDRCCS